MVWIAGLLLLLLVALLGYLDEQRQNPGAKSFSPSDRRKYDE